MAKAGSVNKAQIALVDDHPLFREGLAVALRREPDLDVVGEVGSAQEALELAGRVALDGAVVDILMPTVSGLSLTASSTSASRAAACSGSR